MRKKRVVGKKRPARRPQEAARKHLAPKDWRPSTIVTEELMGLGPGTGGQSGDIEGLPFTPFGNSESVAELVEEGQDLEAEKISGIENAPDPDEVEVEESSLE